MARVGLKRTLPFHVTLPKKIEPTMLARRSESVNRRRVCYSLRPFQPGPGANFHVPFGLSPKFSTPVEKTVEIRMDATE